MKSINKWQGLIVMGILAQNQTTSPKTLYDSPTNWTQYILTDTITTQVNDTIIIFLSAGCTEVIDGKVLFDVVEFTKFPQ